MTDTNSKAQVTEKMVNAADSVLSRSRPGIPDEIIALAISAALAAQEKPEPGVVVKALEWKRCGWVEAFSQPDELGFWYAIQPDKPVHGPGDPPFSCVVIWGVPGQSMRRYLGQDFQNVEAAKAAAQADYEQRIRSALVTPSPDLPEGEVTRKFNLGDHVHKVKGASWTGHVVGFYSTELTPIGYAVESSREKGSVQIYPEAALEFSTSPSPIDKGEVK